MGRILVAAILAAMLVPAAAPAEPLDVKKALWHCQNNDYDRAAIDACTDIITNKAGIAKEVLAAAYFARGESLLNLRLDSLAREDFTAAIDLGMKTRRVFVRRAILLAQRGKDTESRMDMEKALADYTMALTITELPEGNMDDAAVYGSRAYVDFHLGKTEASLADFDKALELNPKNGEYYSARGFVYASLKQYPKAIADYDKATELNANDFRIYLRRSIAYRNLGETAKADADYEKARQLNPRVPERTGQTDKDE